MDDGLASERLFIICTILYRNYFMYEHFRGIVEHLHAYSKYS